MQVPPGRAPRGKEREVAKAASLLKLSERQARRLWKRYRDRGDAGLVHGLRGKASNRRAADATREAVLGLYREKYADFGPTLACGHLAADGHVVNRETLRQWLLAGGLLALTLGSDPLYRLADFFRRRDRRGLPRFSTRNHANALWSSPCL